MPKPTVSILIPSYNSAPYLRPLCESIQSQTFPDFEAIIWDDGSTDNSSEVIQPFLQDRRFQFLKAPRNQGVGKSWSELLARMQGDYWCAPGSDDVLHPDFLERRVARLSTHPTAVMVHGPPVFIDAEGRERPDLSMVANPPTVQSGQDALIALLQHNYINQPSTLIRVSSTRRVLPRWRDDWKFAQEWHLWILFAALGQDFVHDPVPAHQYRVHERSLTHLKGHDAVRRLEVRLVPLVAAGTAADLSAHARSVWLRWRRALYALWLRRAWVLRRHNGTKAAVRTAQETFAPARGRAAGLGSELVRHAPEILWFGMCEARARRRQRFGVSGLAQIDHQLFRAR